MLKSVHPCTLFNVEFLLRKNVAAAYNPGHPCPSRYVEDFSVAAGMPLFGNVHPCTFPNSEFAFANIAFA